MRYIITLAVGGLVAILCKVGEYALEVTSQAMVQRDGASKPFQELAPQLAACVWKALWLEILFYFTLAFTAALLLFFWIRQRKKKDSLPLPDPGS
jgi:hypothetical protein